MRVFDRNDKSMKFCKYNERYISSRVQQKGPTIVETKSTLARENINIKIVSDTSMKFCE